MSIKDRSRKQDDGHAKIVTPLEAGTHTFKVAGGSLITKPGTYGSSLLIPFEVVASDNTTNIGKRLSYFFNVEGDNMDYVRKAESDLCTVLDQLGVSEQVDDRLGNPDFLFDPKVVGQLPEVIDVVAGGKYIKFTIIIGRGDNPRVVDSDVAGVAPAEPVAVGSNYTT